MSFSNTNAGVPAGPTIDDGLLLKVFSGETLVTFNAQTVWKGRHREKTIQSGRSAQFPAIGKVSAAYHTPGQVILGQAVDQGEKTVTIDDLLIADIFVSNFQEAMNHYETRSEYSVQMAQALSQAYDQHLFALATKACVAGTAGAVTGMGAATKDDIGATPNTAAVVTSIYDAARHFDTTNIPKDGRTVFVTPDIYWDLIEDGSFLNRDFGNGSGSQATGDLMKVAGFSVVETNNLNLNFGTASVSGSQNGSATTDYDVNAATSLALVAQSQALGTVKLMEMASEQKYFMERQGSLMISRYACGHDLLRPECLRLIRAVD